MALVSLGLQKTSLIDYPGEIATVLFTPGCNLHCPYCHNPELVSGEIPEDFVPIEVVLSLLAKRRGMVRAVCITGGEPLLHEELPDLIREIRGMGFLVKLDTNGTLPRRLASVKVDYIAMDIKTAPSRYGLVLRDGTGAAAGAAVAKTVEQSVRYIIESGTPHEFRTTLVPGIVEERDMELIAELIRGCDRYVGAMFRPGKTLSPAYRTAEPYTKTAAQGLLSFCSARGIRTELRE